MTFPLSEPIIDILVKLENATFGKFNSELFNNLNWEIKKGETWAITGPSGAGKTTLAEGVLGKYPVREGKIHYNFGSGNTALTQQISLVSFTPNTHRLNYQNFYYQQRYNSSDAEASISVQEFLTESILPGNKNYNRVIKLLKIKDLLPLDVIKLSNGQTRKMLIARALLQNTRFLILDNPYSGLDINNRKDLDTILSNLIAHGTSLLLITNQDHIPHYISNVLFLVNFKIAGKYSRTEYLGKVLKSKCEKTFNPSNVSHQLFSKTAPDDFDVAVQFVNTNVQYDGRKILNDIKWTVKKGEKWALVGPNGSGKTTLLSLINGDNPQAFANKITLFDRRKGTGESIWDIKKRIGFVSPELHLYFRQNMSGETVVATGFLDTLYVNRKITSQETEIIKNFFSYLEIPHLKEKSFLQMSSGEQRLILIIRSLVKNPPVLIWDEPFQGLSSTLLQKATDLLAAYATPDKTIILVSHYDQEIPKWISNTLYLEDGAIKEIVQH